MNADEIFPIVDESGITIGRATRTECHSGSMLLHPVVHLHLVKPGVGLFLQQRNHNKDIQPDRWDTSVGGHVDYGESVTDALRRECREELSVDIDCIELQQLDSYIFQSDRERELINPFIGIAQDAVFPKINPDEIQDGRFWSIEDIGSNLGTGLFTPNFEKEYGKIKHLLIKIVNNR